MGKLKALFWFLVIAFVLYSFGAWFLDNPANAGEAASGIGKTLSDMKDALGIFWSTLFK